MDRIKIGDEVIVDGIYMVYLGFGKFLANDGSGIHEDLDDPQKTGKTYFALAQEIIKAGGISE